jgi:hypothetical protein
VEPPPLPPVWTGLIVKGGKFFALDRSDLSGLVFEDKWRFAPAPAYAVRPHARWPLFGVARRQTTAVKTGTFNYIG